MLDRQTFDRVKEKHGGYASWAVWAPPTSGPKSNTGDLSVLDPDRDPKLLETLRSDVVMIGLNLSRSMPEPLGNFHDPSSKGQDYKIRFAFGGTPYYGAYMTDFVKGVVMLKSGNLMRHVANTRGLVAENVDHLLREFDDLEAGSPTVIAFGADAYLLAAKYLPTNRYSRLVRVTHYSHYISKEDYQARVLAELTV